MHIRTRIGRVAALLMLVMLAGPAAGSVTSELAFHRGVVAYGEANYEEAQRQFQIVLDADAEDTVALHYLAMIAQKRGDPTRAFALYAQALAIDPEDADIWMDQGIAQLEAGQLVEARASFDRVLALEPERARAHLFAGIAAYRGGDYPGAKPHFARAGELDPTLLDESRYYTGLAEAFAGNLDGASVAFGDAMQQSPQSPLGQSAQNVRDQIETARRSDRRWQAALTAGMEYDTNPLIIGSSTTAIPVPGSEPDWRGVVRPRGSYQVVRSDSGNVIVGYEGFWSFHIDETEVNLQTHNPWVSGNYQLGPVRLGLRYDYGFTFLDTTDPFLSQNRVTPSVAFQQSDWGVTSVYYQWEDQDFLRDLVDPPVFDRDGSRNLAGLNQFFFLPAPFTYVRLGASADWLRTQGTEWSYNGIDALMGAGYDFDYDIGFSWQYRYSYRHYTHQSALAVPPEKQDVNRHVLTVDITKGITEHWDVSLGGAFTWNNSDVAFYEYDRQVGGAYATYRF